MNIPRLFTAPDNSPFEGMALRAWSDEDWLEYTVPAHWGQAAVETLVRCVFHHGALPALTSRVEEAGVPVWLQRRVADEAGLDALSAEGRFSYERDVRAVFARIAGGLAYQGWKAGLFASEEDARAFHDELCCALLRQRVVLETGLMAAAGLNWAYGLDGAEVFTPAARIAGFAPDMALSRGAGAGVIVDARTQERHVLAQLKVLGARLALAGAAEKTAITLPVENVDSAAFIALFRQADIDASAQDVGLHTLREAMLDVMDACDRDSIFGYDPARCAPLKQAVARARAAGVTQAAVQTAIAYAQQGYESIALGTAAPDDDVPAPESTLSTTLSVPDDFIELALTGHGFLLQDGGQAARHVSAENMWSLCAESIWASGAPALFFRDSADATQGTGLSGAGGLVFLPGTAAPAGVVNAAAFAVTTGSRVVDAAGLMHAAMLVTVALEASLSMSAATQKTQDYRPLCVGLTGLAPLLMQAAVPYDSDAGRATASLVCAAVSGAAHAASAALAKRLGACAAYRLQETEVLQTVKDKIAALSGTQYMHKGVTRRPLRLQAHACPDAALQQAVAAQWAQVYQAGKEAGFRHMHLTAMDTPIHERNMLCVQESDIAPAGAVVRFEGRAAHAQEEDAPYAKTLHQAVPAALRRLGYGAQAIDDIHFYALGHGTLLDAPAINHAALRAKGFCKAALDALEAALVTAQHIRYVFNKWTLGAEFCSHVLGLEAEALESGAFDMLAALGFSEDEIEAANIYCCGAMTLEGAPHLLPEHLDIFDCKTPAGHGVRRVAGAAEIKMQGALEPFLSGAVMHTVELDHAATVEDVQKLLLQAWELGLKRVKLYRDNCGLLYGAAAPSAEFDDKRFAHGDGDGSAVCEGAGNLPRFQLS